MNTASTEAKCVIILSTKSSGSSALQELLCEYGGGRHLRHTWHAEFETLYWTKAASILGLPQIRLPASEVPIPKDRASRELRRLLSDNVPGITLSNDDNRLIFSGWRDLCLAHAPILVEKSPHHLHQWSCLDLMIQAVHALPAIDFRFVGLVRNPMDVAYSAWSRWRIPPATFQNHWRMAYENLERFRDAAGNRLVIVRYEDFSSKSQNATWLLHSLGMQATRTGTDEYIHGDARSRWRTDPDFDFQLDASTAAVALRYGYTTQDLANNRQIPWSLRRAVSTSAFRWLARPLSQARRKLRYRLRTKSS